MLFDRYWIRLRNKWLLRARLELTTRSRATSFKQGLSRERIEDSKYFAITSNRFNMSHFVYSNTAEAVYVWSQGAIKEHTSSVP